jgi:ABC-type glutathione transport system ATPase component
MGGSPLEFERVPGNEKNACASGNPAYYGARSVKMSTLNQTVPALAVREVSFARDKVTVLGDVSLQIAAGEFFCLLGPSGSGKTTLLRVVSGLDKPTSLDFHGKELT